MILDKVPVTIVLPFATIHSVVYNRHAAAMRRSNVVGKCMLNVIH